ncbi:MAG: Gfo/Idh/MocA family oxidoreductase [candidate division KSB1 bacterium]|nr:Gfo/Idh/MocA family oxidoreductase [candidate division KSB1 bacterium]MDZ7276087.1 Gfo/Idh/MocA family oxidoreductase [candidate division KSB1 bacterium]MDZ7287133.1 Gfo/Idh/MocA family oxidoreductase [candidate division KSB1 bacterium]MDZ7296942.1 Gfo/Idh/MocA family oxidoreductase [candidate division KSB1 bacterium]MDZ7307167.1 Gfo/Idh/MocA family oxidoreductase [candidate division KSB1 bacterium]
MKIGVVGLGYWGPNLVRNFFATEGVEGVVCCDIEEQRLHKIRKVFPNAEVTTSFESLLQRPEVTALAIATPVSSHYPLALRALRAGKHVLLEKPMTTRVEHARELIALAREQGLTLMVDHTFVYTGAVRKIKEMIQRGEIGDILYFDSVRVNLGLFQHDTNVIWDLAPHDVSIMDHLIDREPVSVSAVGVSHYNCLEDVAYLTVHFADQLLAHFHVNWLSPVKVRRILLGGSKHMVVYDDMEPSEKVKVYNRGVEITEKESVYQTLVQYRMGDMYAPKIDQTEALSRLTAEFADCIRTGRRPLTDGTAGCNVVRILEAAEQSLRSGGRVVPLATHSRKEFSWKTIKEYQQMSSLAGTFESSPS